MTLAAQLAAFPDIRTVIVEQKPGPLQLGQADGVACRTMEMFGAFGFAHKVLKEGYCPESLLHTYSAERQAVAQELIDFDREWAAMLSGSVGAPEAKDGAQVQRYFVQHGRYTAGTATRYKPALLTGEATHQHLAEGLLIGTRFHSAPVLRVGDGKLMQLGESLTADGRWRLIAFAGRGDDASATSPLGKLCGHLTESPDSPLASTASKAVWSSCGPTSTSRTSCRCKRRMRSARSSAASC